MKTVIITGASSGLGAEFARRLAKKKETEAVWLIARRADKLEAVASELQAARPELSIRTLSLDLSTEEAITKYAACLAEEKPEVRYLVCAAGFGKIGSNLEIPRSELDKMVLLNVKGAMDVTHETLAYMGKKSRILEICSTSAFQPMGHLSVYAATKAFLLSYSRSLRFELFPKKVLVTAVCPYWVKDTGFIPIAEGSEGKKRSGHYSLASRTSSVVRWALFDAALGLSVSTPGPVCLLHELVCKFLPHGLMLSVWEGLRRL